MIYIIAARSKNGVIGKNGKIPWKIPGEQKRFKRLTVGNAVVMGRKTHEEIGRPLPDRLNIVVSTTKSFQGENLKTAANLHKALEMAEGRDVYISGGSRLYREAISLADKIYLTEIDAEIDGDVFFPEFDLSLFTKTTDEVFGGEIPYAYVTYTRK